MADTAAHLVDRVLPEVPIGLVALIVLIVPWRSRPRLFAPESGSETLAEASASRA